MTKTSKTIVFFGSGPVAATSLELLAKHQVVTDVITKPSTFQQMSTVTPEGAKLHAVNTKAELDDLIATLDCSDQIGIIIDFGIIVSTKVIDAFSSGIINSHFSLLPEWRGADPISFAILSGQDKTGVTLMLLSEGLDEGTVLSMGEQPIDRDDTTPTLTKKLIYLSDALLEDFLPKYSADPKPGIPQEKAAELTGRPAEISYSRKLTKTDGRLDWTKPAEVLEREIRAYIEWPRSYTILQGIDIIVTEAHVVELSGKPGDFSADKKSLTIYCGVNALSIDRIQPAGKNAMPIAAFLAGYSLENRN